MSARETALRQVQVTWRCEASDFAPDSFRRRHNLRRCKTWTRGKTSLGKIEFDTSGLGQTVGLATSDQELLTLIHDFLVGHQHALEEARLLGATNTMSILLMAGKGAAASVVELPSAMLAKLGLLGVRLEIVAPQLR